MAPAGPLDDARSLADLVAAFKRRGARPALVAFDGESATETGFAELAARSRRFAAWLAADRQARGRPVAVFGPNGVEAVTARLGLILAGAVCVPVDVDADARRLAGLLADSGARTLFAAAAFLDTAREAAAALDDEIEIFLLDGPAGGEFPRLADLEAGAAGESGPADPDAPVARFYTSGTTGLPKAVPLTHRHVLTNLRVLLDLGVVGPDDRVVLPLPLHHSYPLIVGLLLPLAAGAAVVLPASLAGADFIRAVREGGATVAVGVPRLYDAFVAGLDARVAALGGAKGLLLRSLVGAALLARRRLGWRIGRALLRPLHAGLAPRLRVLACGGARLEPETEWRLEGLGYSVLTGYGLVETASIAAFNRPGAARVGSAGRPSPAVEMRIAPVAGMEDGEIQFRGPIVFDGYANDAEANAGAFVDGWFRTGDLGRLDADGFLFVTGRIKETIPLPDGKNVAPGEVEEVYSRSPFVDEIGVLERGGALAAVVVPDMAALRRAGQADVAQQLRLSFGELGRGLPGYMRLADFAVARESLPRNQLGKLRRFRLPEIYDRAERRRRGGGEAGAAIEVSSARGRAALAWLERRFPDAALGPDTALQMDLDVDSLSWLELGLELERETGVRLTEETIAGLIDVRDLMEAVESADAEAPGAAGAGADDGRWLAEPGPWARACGRLVHLAARCAARAAFGLKTRGRPPGPESGPVIVAANHLSDLDPLVLAAALPPAALARLWWGGDAKRVFSSRAGRALARAARVFPVDDRAPDASLERAAETLRRGRALAWFPEEWRSPDGRLQPFRAGIGALVDRTGADVLPVAIAGTFEAMPRTARLPRPGRVTVTFGAPIPARELTAGAPAGPGPARYRAIAARLREAMAAVAAGRRSPVAGGAPSPAPSADH